MDRIRDRVRILLMFEPLDDITLKEAQMFLEQHYPEARWRVWFEDDRLEIDAIFDNETDRTFYLLKWS